MDWSNPCVQLTMSPWSSSNKVSRHQGAGELSWLATLFVFIVTQCWQERYHCTQILWERTIPCVELSWTLPHASLLLFQFFFFVINHDYVKYKSYLWVLSPSCKLSKLRVVLRTPTLGIGVKSADSQWFETFSNFTTVFWLHCFSWRFVSVFMVFFSLYVMFFPLVAFTLSSLFTGYKQSGHIYFSYIPCICV